jgi:hypothetical protein
MSDIISLYPIYNPEVTKEIFDLQPYKLDYIDEDGSIYPLSLKSDDLRGNLFYIDDPDNIWIHENYGFNISKELTIKDPSCLFGSHNNAIACTGSTLGIAFQWSSKTSSRKRTKKICSFKEDDKDIKLNISESFKKSELRGEVSFTILLYLESSGIPQEGEELFVNQAGHLLGELDSIGIQIDGNGSMLPVFYEDVRGGTLWRVNCNFADPSSDSFSNPETVSIIINRKNPNFKFIDKKNESYNQQMANEVMASAISMIVESLRATDVNFTTLNNPECGSVSDAIRYFRDVLSWDLSTPIAFNKSIREAFEKKN